LLLLRVKLPLPKPEVSSAQLLFKAPIDSSSSGEIAEVTPAAEIAEKTQAPDAFAQVTSVSQLSDVQPTDWAFQAFAVIS